VGLTQPDSFRGRSLKVTLTNVRVPFPCFLPERNSESSSDGVPYSVFLIVFTWAGLQRECAPGGLRAATAAPAVGAGLSGIGVAKGPPGRIGWSDDAEKTTLRLGCIMLHHNEIGTAFERATL